MEGSGRARRLIFRYRDAEFVLVAAIDVAVRVPPSDDTEERTPRAPFYFELQDGAGRVLYRRRRPHPASSTVEVPTGDSTRPFVHAERTEQAEGAFSILVPAPPEGEFVELFGTSDGRIDQLAASLGRFDLRSVPGSLYPPFGDEGQ